MAESKQVKTQKRKRRSSKTRGCYLYAFLNVEQLNKKRVSLNQPVVSRALGDFEINIPKTYLL